jgi:hypothetical protein
MPVCLSAALEAAFAWLLCQLLHRKSIPSSIPSSIRPSSPALLWWRVACAIAPPSTRSPPPTRSPGERRSWQMGRPDVQDGKMTAFARSLGLSSGLPSLARGFLWNGAGSTISDLPPRSYKPQPGRALLKFGRLIIIAIISTTRRIPPLDVFHFRIG